MKQTASLEVGIGVIDFERMYAFYTEVLGCRENRRADIPGELSSQLTLAADGYLCVWLETPGGEVIKLMSPSTPPEPQRPPDYLTARTGIAFLTFYCENLETVLAAAEDNGAVLRSGRALASGDGPLKLCFFSDPEGNIIELVETSG